MRPGLATSLRGGGLPGPRSAYGYTVRLILFARILGPFAAQLGTTPVALLFLGIVVARQVVEVLACFLNGVKPDIKFCFLR